MKKKAGLVLSGGGSLGIAHIGALEILLEKYEFDYIGGVSAGAIIGAAVALGKSAEEIWAIFNDTNLFDMALDLSPKNSGLVKGRKIHKLLREVYEDKHFSDLAVPFFVGATNFENGDRVILREGKIADAVRASLGIPLVFEPYKPPETGDKLVDGFLSQNFPLDLAIEEYKGDCIVGIDVSSVPPIPDNFGHKRLFGRNKMMFHIMQRQLRIMYKNQQTHFPKDPRLVIYRPQLAAFSSMTIGHKNFKRIREQGRLCVLEEKPLTDCH